MTDGIRKPEHTKRSEVRFQQKTGARQGRDFDFVATKSKVMTESHRFSKVEGGIPTGRAYKEYH